jgi:phage protein D
MVVAIARRTADSSSRNAVSFSSARTTKRLPSFAAKRLPFCASVYIVIFGPPSMAKATSRKVFMRFFERSNDLVEARGKTVGLPSLRSGAKLDIRGLGARFSGTYLVTSTTHKIGDGGCTTEFSARMQKPKKT